MTHKPTEEQGAIIEQAPKDDSLMVRAYAGCAKTSTLEFSAATLKPQPVLALAFNVKIKDELVKKLPTFFEVKTLNGLGHGAWAKAIGRKVILKDSKIGDLIRPAADSIGVKQLSTDQWNDIRRLVGKAMSTGLVPSKWKHRSTGLLEDTEDSWQDLADAIFIEPEAWTFDIARKVLSESISQSYGGLICFDDQIYMSALFGGAFPRFPRVWCDEAQDLSPLNHIMLQKVAAGPLLVVGDPKQAIYQFRGAATDSMGKIAQLKDSWVNLPLNITFRCPKTIVARQQHHAPGYQAWHTNAAGVYVEWESWGPATLKGLPGSTAVLCRNNAPLIRLAFKLIKSHIGVVMLGRDIGKGLITLAKKIIGDLNLPINLCVGLIQRWMENQLAIASMKRDDAKTSKITDQGESLFAVAEAAGVSDGKGLIKALEDLFGRTAGQITLSTGHRSKGLEWTNVIHLDPFLLPSKQASRAALAGNPLPLEQEWNLQYVIETRTKHLLAAARSQDFTEEGNL